MTEQLLPIHDNVVFAFLEQSNSHSFTETTQSGIVVSGSYDEALNKHRWVVIESVGPEVPDYITVGATVLVEALKWTDRFSVNGKMFWQTKAEFIIAIGEPE